MYLVRCHVVTGHLLFDWLQTRFARRPQMGRVCFRRSKGKYREGEGTAANHGASRMAVVLCICLIVLIHAWASAYPAHASWHGLLSLVPPLRSKVSMPESKPQAPRPYGTWSLPSSPPHPSPPPSLYARSLSDLDLAAGLLAWVLLCALQLCAGGRVAPLVSPLQVIIRPTPLHAAPFMRGARLAALRWTFSSAPRPPRPNKRRAP